ncbi:MAG: hypothetical protein AAF715_16835 [Myxococcota bacterium]
MPFDDIVGALPMLYSLLIVPSVLAAAIVFIPIYQIYYVIAQSSAPVDDHARHPSGSAVSPTIHPARTLGLTIALFAFIQLQLLGKNQLAMMHLTFIPLAITTSYVLTPKRLRLAYHLPVSTFAVLADYAANTPHLAEDFHPADAAVPITLVLLMFSLIPNSWRRGAHAAATGMVALTLAAFLRYAWEHFT